MDARSGPGMGLVGGSESLGLGTNANKVELAQARRQQCQDEIDRIALEGKFRQGKRRVNLGHIMAELSETSETAIFQKGKGSLETFPSY